MLVVGVALGIAAGTGFLHWAGVRPARVLFVDGEMSRRLLKQRLVDEVQRLGMRPEGFHALSHEDVEDFSPLNTPKGQAQIEQAIERIGGVDIVVFDNVMSLISGDMKEEEAWRQTLPWTRKLTKRGIGQIWVHHCGHDDTRSYGTKTREWQMDNVIFLELIERADTDVSFLLQFRKARERTPDTRADFLDVQIALVNDIWTSQATDGTRKGRPSPLGVKFLDALRNATIDSGAPRQHGCPTASIDAWRIECRNVGLLDPDARKDAARSLFSKYKLELIRTNLIACNETHAWTLDGDQLPLKTVGWET